MSLISEKIAALPPAHRELFERLLALQESRNPVAGPIAIIGMGCRFPGGANDPRSFWELLAGGRDAVGEVPRDRWDREAWYSREPDAAGKMASREGGFLEQVDQFDAEFFGVSPREAASIDPQHRLLLETCWEALEDAGIAPQRLHGSPTGVFVGLGTLDYYRAAFSEPKRLGPYCATGTFASAGAGRISYTLGLEGPSLAIDTACSSSLVAVHLACQSLRLRECDVALAGGVSLMIGPELSVSLSKANMLASDGRCKTFDAAADGYGRGEGCGIVVLKPLADAQRDGDPIWAVIPGSAVNQDGRSNGLTAPNGLAQEALLRAALKTAGIAPADVSYVEAHGTGTALGDPIEVGALCKVLGEKRPLDRPLILGSVKTNIGHLEMAAGIAGLIKTALCLAHRQIVPNLHFKKLNPGIAAVTERVPLRIPTQVEPWQPADGRHVAAVSSFGFGGTNAHVLVTAGPETARSQRRPGHSLHVLCISAKKETALRELAGKFARAVHKHPDSIAELCAMANSGRDHFGCRWAVVGSSAQEIGAKLAHLAGAASAGSNGQKPVAGDVTPRLVFSFSGSGLGPIVTRGLGREFPVFRETVERCLESLSGGDRGVCPPSALPEISRALSFDGAGHCPALASRPQDAAVSQELVRFIEQVALASLWKSWGIAADLILAHEAGIAAALHLAGAVSLEDGFRIAAVCARLRNLGSPLNGDAAAVDSADELKTIAFQPIPGNHLVSTAIGRAVTPDDLIDPEFWSALGQRSALVDETFRAVKPADATIFLEIGANAGFFSEGERVLGCGGSRSGCWWLSPFDSRSPDHAQIFETLAHLYVDQAPIDWPSFYREFPRAHLSLPTYPFQRQRYWLEGEKSQKAPAARPPGSNGHRDPPAGSKPQSGVAVRGNGSNGPSHGAAGEFAAPNRSGATSNANGSASGSHLRSVIEACLIRVLELPEGKRIGPDQDLQDLGMDSITALEMLFAVEKSLGRPIRMPGIAKSRTINQFIGLIESCPPHELVERPQPGLHPA